MSDRMLSDEILLGLIKANSGGGGGTTDYEDLENLPQIGGVELKGNKSLADLGIASAQSVSNITNGESINNFAGVETALAGKQNTLTFDNVPTENSNNPVKSGGVYSALSVKQDTLTAGANINMTGNVVKAGVVEVVEPDMTVYGNSTESGSKTYMIETTGVYEIFYCLSLQSTVSVTLPNDANVLFENDLTVSSHPVKHIVAELHEGDTVTIAQTPSQWNAVVSGVLKLDAISVVDVAHTGSVADSTITYTLPNDNKYYLVVGACVGKPTGNNVVDSTSGGTAEITRTLTGSGVRFRSVVVKGSDSPSFSFYGYDGGVASIIAYEIEFEEGNWDYNLATKNYVDTALAGKQNTLTFDDTPTDNSNNPVKSNGIYDALALKQNATDNNLDTEAKTIVGAINEHEGDVVSLKSGLTTLDNEVNGDATVYPYADVITIEDAVPANLAGCNVKIEPVQDLHGQSAPYVGGAGKNKLPLVLADIKAANTDGTWNDNVYTLNGGTITVNTDDGGNVTGIKVNGTFNADTSFKISAFTALADVSYTYNGCPQNGSDSTYLLYVENKPTTYFDYGNGATWLIGSDTEMSTAIFVKSGYNAQNLMFYPMVCLSSESDKSFAPYTNICPITGHTEASVQRNGKNFCPYAKLGALSEEFLLPSGNYTFSFKLLGSAKYSTSNVRIVTGEEAICTILPQGKNPGTVLSAQFELTESSMVQIRHSNMNADADGYFEGDIQIELGSTATPYEPYAGKTYTIALGDTIYGGTVDFNTGVMTVTHAVVDMGSIDYTVTSGAGYSLFYTLPNPLTNMANYLDTEKANAFCSVMPIETTINVNEGVKDGLSIGPDNSRIRVCSKSAYMGMTKEQFKTAMDGVQLVYELATPTTIQLTPQQIQLLKGTNTLTASTGQISVTVNGVSGAIGAVQEQVNEIETRLETTESNITTLQSGVVKKTLIFSGISSKVITFSGKIHCRNVAMFLVCGGQTGVGNPISIMFTGESTGVQTMTSVQVATNSDGVTASGLSITIPAELYGEWGNHTLIELFPDDNYTYTVTDAT